MYYRYLSSETIFLSILTAENSKIDVAFLNCAVSSSGDCNTSTPDDERALIHINCVSTLSAAKHNATVHEYKEEREREERGREGGEGGRERGREGGRKEEREREITLTHF